MDIDLTKLPIGGVFHLGSDRYEVVKVTSKTLLFDVNGTRKRMTIRSKAWPQFARDVEGLLLASCHGVDAGCLTECIVGS